MTTKRKKLKLSAQDRADIFNRAARAWWAPLRERAETGNGFWATQFAEAWLSSAEKKVAQEITETYSKAWVPTMSKLYFEDKWSGRDDLPKPARFLRVSALEELLTATGSSKRWAGIKSHSWGDSQAVSRLTGQWKSSQEERLEAIRGRLSRSPTTLSAPIQVPPYLIAPHHAQGELLIDHRLGAEREAAHRVNRIAKVLPKFEAWKERLVESVSEVVEGLMELRRLLDAMQSDADLEKHWPEGENFWNPVMLEKQAALLQRKQLPATIESVQPMDLTEVRERLAKGLGLTMPGAAA